MNSAMPTPMDVKVMNLTAAALFLAFSVLAGIAAVRWAVRLSIFDIKSIVVVGDVSHNNAVTLRANVAPRLAGSFFSIDLQRVRAAFEAVPWVRHAMVHREFPNRLKVTLQEHQAVAYWGHDSEQRLINNFGEVFEANVGEVEQESLPLLNGPEGQGAEVLAMYRVLVPLFEQMEMSVDELELSKGGSWHVALDGGASIELGRGTTADIAARVRRFLTTLTQVTSRFGRQPGALESADLRHDNGYAIRLHGITTTALATTPQK